MHYISNQTIRNIVRRFNQGTGFSLLPDCKTLPVYILTPFQPVVWSDAAIDRLLNDVEAGE